MKKVFYKNSLILFFIFLQGCTSSLMMESTRNTVNPSEDEYATIIFMRSSFVASGIGVELFEINNGELEFVGALPNGSKIAHKTTPGQKVYMAYGTAADFMIANVEGKKTYYSIVRPNWGTGGFAPTPIRNDGTTDYNTNIAEFGKWKEGTKLLEKKPKAKEWFSKNREKYKEIYNRYWSIFQSKTDAQKKERTILESDGM